MADQPPADQPALVGLDFDARNVAKLAAHGIEPTDIWDVLTGEPRWFVEGRRGRSGTHWMIGPLATGRHLTIVMVLVDTEAAIWRPITGWPSTKREVRAWHDAR